MLLPIRVAKASEYVPDMKLAPVHHLQLTQNRARDIQDSVVSDQPIIIRPGEYAPPVQEPKVQAKPEVDTNLYGAVGTPILSGFVTELGEYNPELRGRNALPVYEKMRRSDADVAALLSAIKLPIRSAEYRVVPGVEESDPEFKFAKEMADFVKENLFGGLEYTNSLGMHFSQTWDSVISNILLCIDFGCSGYEDIWTVDGDKVRLKRMAQRLPLTFYRFHIEEDGETLRSVEQWGYRGSTFVNVAVPADKFTLFTFRQEGANFYGRPILREIYQSWYIKQALYRIDSIAAERNGAGVPVVTLPPNADIQDKTAAGQFVQNLSVHESMGITLPNLAKFELISVTGQVRQILPSIQHHSEMICRGGLAMFMTLGTTQSGSRALGNSMIDFFQLSEEATAKFVCDTINQTTVRRLCDLNYYRGPDKPIPYPKVVVPHIAVLNPLDLLSAIKEVSASTTDLLQPDDVLEGWIREKVGLPVKGTPRPRFAPVVQRMQEQGSNPEAVEGDTADKAAEGDVSAKPKLKKVASAPTALPTPAQVQQQAQQESQQQEQKKQNEGKLPVAKTPVQQNPVAVTRTKHATPTEKTPTVQQQREGIVYRGMTLTDQELYTFLDQKEISFKEEVSVSDDADKVTELLREQSGNLVLLEIEGAVEAIEAGDKFKVGEVVREEDYTRVRLWLA